ncbi:IS110 family transposase [Collinsella aerofaciens]|uniref:transposase n=1 Tax=Collinsella TaxID=102106 RepID=UPI00117F192C|nr:MULTISPECIES: transposase [Collinsella]MCO7115723.1 IS110 family transposase [Collinsella aerofaciens]
MTEVPGGVLAIPLFAGVSAWGSPTRGSRPPRTAANLAVSFDIARFPDHDHLASYRGIAPRVRSFGTSIRAPAQRRPVRRSAERRKSLAAQVSLAHVVVVQELLAGAGHGDLAGLEHVAARGD